MALAMRVTKSSDFAVIFAAHDVFISILAGARNRFPREEMTEVYTAPFVYLHAQFKRSNDEGGWIIFTPMTPWPHELHYLALNQLKRLGIKICSVEKSVEACQEMLKHDDDTISIFTTHGGYPRIEDIGLSLDERAVRITCAAAGWKYPEDFQEKRIEIVKQRYRGVEYITVGDFLAGYNKENGVDSKQDKDTRADDDLAEEREIVHR